MRSFRKFTMAILGRKSVSSKHLLWICLALLVLLLANNNLTVIHEETAIRLPIANQTQCNVPRLKVFDAQIMNFYKKLDPLKCSSGKNWVRIHQRHILIDQSANKEHGPINCLINQFDRISDKKLTNTNPISLLNNSKLKGDFCEVKCTAADGSTFENIYATIAQVKRKTVKTRSKIKSAGLNVHILGLDSISAMAMQRLLPESYEYLTKDLEAVVMEGYNIVGDGTPQAFIPILTGKTELELPNTRRADKGSDYVDVYPFIWKNFSNAGYATLYAEDAARIGTFTYRLNGFKQQPTDHYLRTFYQKYESLPSNSHNSYCLGDEPLHRVFWRYAADFYANYPISHPKFSLVHYSQLTHDDINSAQLIDNDLKEHLSWMKDEKHLNNTLLILMADHGHRFEKVRSVPQGLLEERLPFMSFAAPKWFREGPGKAQWLHLQSNALKLTSPFDIHATLMEVLDWNKPPDQVSQNVSATRSLSLWHRVPSNRTCSQAGIAAHWCTCLKWYHVSSESSDAQFVSLKVVDAINNATAAERKLCAPLTLTKVEYAKGMQPNDELMQYKGVLDAHGFVADLSRIVKIPASTYQVRLRTSPGDGLFEATVVYDSLDRARTQVDLQYVSHINKFGDQPHCIIDRVYALAKWCICYDRI